MTARADIDAFLAERTLAVVGVSRHPRKFGNVIYRELKAKGYRLFPVHPEAEILEGDPCVASLRALPEPVGGVVVVVPPAQTEKVVREAAEAGIRRVWMQQGAESEESVRYCAEQGLSAVHGQCILMFAEPAAFFHRAHRWVRGVMGRLPT
jgi:hypothetical protein